MISNNVLQLFEYLFEFIQCGYNLFWNKKKISNMSLIYDFKLIRIICLIRDISHFAKIMVFLFLYII